MNKELIIRTQNNTVDFALLKDGKLVELHREEGDNSFSVGDIFLAKVRKPVTGLNAAFVNVGYHKDAFLHYHDLGPRIGSLMSFTKGVLSKKNYGFQFDKLSARKRNR